MKTNATYFVNDKERPIRYGEINLINPLRRRLRSQPEKEGIEAVPVFCGFCGTDFELMKMGREGALDAKFPAGETRLILQLIREFPVTNFRLRLLKFPKMTED